MHLHFIIAELTRKILLYEFDVLYIFDIHIVVLIRYRNSFDF